MSIFSDSQILMGLTLLGSVLAAYAATPPGTS